MSHDLTDPEVRVLGCLLEKQRMTPDAYPLTLNALRAACNQSTNRDPVVQYDEGVAEAVLAVLLLRGPQTPGELRQRTDRLHHFGSAEELDAAIEGLADRDLVVRLERRPGQKESRYAHLLGGEVADTAAVVVAPGPVVEERQAPAPAASPPLAPPPDPARDERLSRLEAEVAELRAQVQAMRAELGMG